MADEMEQNDPAMTSDEAIPYEQEYETEMEREVTCSGADFVKVKGYESAALCTFQWGRIPFEVGLERIQVTEETHKDLILNVVCNKKAHDAHWRCAFSVTAQCNIERQDGWEFAEQSMTATKGFNTLVIPIMRLPEDADQSTFATLKIKIKINSWAGSFPTMLKSFTQKTTITDAILKVEGRRLYVTRAILAMHSTYFHTLFFDNRYPDASKTEFDLSDVSLDEMTLFLNIIYPNVTDDRPLLISSVETIESLLMLAERFGSDCVKRLMEKYLMGEMPGEIEGSTLARRLLISDRFRLSAPSGMIMNELRNEGELRRLGETEEYRLLSDATRASILDMRMQSSDERKSPETPDADFYWGVGTPHPTHIVYTPVGNTAARARAAQPPQPASRPVASMPVPPAILHPHVTQFPPAYQRPHQSSSNTSHPLFPAPSLHHSFLQPPNGPPPTRSPQAFPHLWTEIQTFQASLGPPPAGPPTTRPLHAVSEDRMWTEFQADLGPVDTALANLPLSQSQADQRDAAIRYLRAMTRPEYDQLSFIHRMELRAVMRRLAGNASASNHLLSRFLALVDEMRSRNGPSTSSSRAPKRRRQESH